MKKIYYILTFLLCVYVQTANAQMGVNSTGAAPNAAAMLDVRSSDKGFLMPRMTTTQRNAMPAIADGLMIYNTTTAEIEVYRGLLGWKVASRMGVPFNVSGSIAVGGSGVIDAVNTGTGDAIRADGNTGVRAFGVATGVYGEAAGGTGIFGRSDTYRGVWGRGITTGDGVYGDAVSGNAIRGAATTGKGVFGSSSSNGTGVQGTSVSGYGGFFQSDSYTGLEASSLSSYAIVGSNTSATIPVAQFGNLSGGTALEVIASTAIKITGAIKVAGGSSAPAFKIVSSAGNVILNQLIIPNTTLANNANDILIVTHNYGSGGPYLDKTHGVFWSGSNWRIYLEDTSAMPVGATFNVLVIKQ